MIVSGAELVVAGLGVDIEGRHIVQDVDFVAHPGQVVGILGPNGSGKATMLRSIFHSRRPTKGTVTVDGVDVWSRDTKWSSQHISVVLQETSAEFPLTCGEIVRMGRTPHKKSWRSLSEGDLALCGAAMELMEVGDLATSTFSRISGGERQRVTIARALAQQTGLLIMDEPTNHLDIHHQLKVVELSRRLRSTVVVALHDISLAARFCDTLVLMSKGKCVAAGAPSAVLSPGILDDVYKVYTHLGRHPSGAVQVTVL